MPKYTVAITRIYYYDVEAPNEEKATDLAFTRDEHDGDETLRHEVLPRKVGEKRGYA